MDTRVRDILRRKGRDVLTATPDMTVYDCIASMVEHNVGSILIMEGNKVAGIFTERDYLRRIVLEGRTSKTTRVEEVMTTKVLHVTPETRVDSCMDLMTEHKCRHLPVLNDEDQLEGIISIGDCVKQVSHAAQTEAHTLKQFITGRYPA